MADKRNIDMLRFYGGDIRKRTEDGKFLIMNSLKNPRDQKDLLWGDENAYRTLNALLFDGYEKIAIRYFQKQLGVLYECAAADVIVIDYDPLTPMNESNINGHLMFGVNGSMVQTTVCNGKVLMKDREVLVCDEAKVMADCRQAAKELPDDFNG